MSELEVEMLKLSGDTEPKSLKAGKGLGWPSHLSAN